MSTGTKQSWWLTLAFCALAVSITVGCGASKPLVERPWVEVSTPNFQVMSSLSEERSVELARELESFRAAVAQILGIPLPERDVPTRVYVIDDQEEWDQIAPQANLGGYFFQGWRRAVMAINAAGDSAHSQHMVRHEYVHKLLEQSGAMYPLWYEEGIAEFFGTSKLDDGIVKLGVPPARFGLLRIAQPNRFGSQASVGSHIVRDPADDAAVAGDDFYARAWARVDYLHLAQEGPKKGLDLRSRIRVFLTLYNRGRPHDEAFAEAFGMSVAELDSRVEDYLRQDELPTVTIRVEVPGGAGTRVQPMPRAQVTRVLAELALSTGKLERAAALLEDAPSGVRDARTLSVLARLRKRQERPKEARRLFESAIELAPKDPIPRLDYAQYLLTAVGDAPPAVAKETIEEARVHIRVALEQDMDRPEPHALYGMTYFLDEDSAPHEGIRAFAHAAKLLPRDGPIYFFLAKLLLRIDEVDQARELLQIVQQSAHGGAIAEQARELLRSLGQGDS